MRIIGWGNCTSLRNKIKKLALVKLGDIAKRNNNEAQAKKYYQQVVDEYPTSASAKVASENLK